MGIQNSNGNNRNLPNVAVVHDARQGTINQKFP
jgi:hypothetical protein